MARPIASRRLAAFLAGPGAVLAGYAARTAGPPGPARAPVIMTRSLPGAGTVEGGHPPEAGISHGALPPWPGKPRLRGHAPAVPSRNIFLPDSYDKY